MTVKESDSCSMVCKGLILRIATKSNVTLARQYCDITMMRNHASEVFVQTVGRENAASREIT